MADVTLLRTLTRKSTLKYGHNHDKTVAQMLVDSPWSLVNDYYRLEAITFEPSILDELLITPEKRIPKPGKLSRDADVFSEDVKQQISDSMKSGLTREQVLGDISRKKRIARERAANSESALAWRSADRLRRKNHGH
jgi:hypothetical protein